MDFNDLLVVYKALVAVGNKELVAKLAWVRDLSPMLASQEALGWSCKAVTERARVLFLPMPFIYGDTTKLVLQRNNKRCTVSCYLGHDRESYDCGFHDVRIQFEVAVYQKYKAGKKGVPFSGRWVECKSTDKDAELNWVDDENNDYDGEFYSIEHGSEYNELKRIVGDWWKLLNQI